MGFREPLKVGSSVAVAVRLHLCACPCVRAAVRRMPRADLQRRARARSRLPPLAVSPRARVCERTQAWEIAFLLVFWLPVLYLLIQWDGEARILKKKYPSVVVTSYSKCARALTFENLCQLVNKPLFWVFVSWFFWLYHHGAQAFGVLFALVSKP